MVGRARYIERGAGEAQGTRTFLRLVGPKMVALHTNRLSSLCGLALQPSGGFFFNRLEVRLQPQHRSRLLVRRPRHHTRRSKSTDRRQTLTSQAPRRCREGQPPRVDARRARLLNQDRSKSSSNGERASRRSSMWRSRHVSSVPRREDLSRGGTRKPDSDFPAKRNCRHLADHPARFTTNRGV